MVTESKFRHRTFFLKTPNAAKVAGAEVFGKSLETFH